MHKGGSSRIRDDLHVVVLDSIGVWAVRPVLANVHFSVHQIYPLQRALQRFSVSTDPDFKNSSECHLHGIVLPGQIWNGVHSLQNIGNGALIPTRSISPVVVV